MTTPFIKHSKLFLNLYFILLLSYLFFLNSCTPKIYIIDHQTVLYETAAGEWPEFEKSLLLRMKKKAPMPFSQIPASENEKTKRLFRVIDGELTANSEGRL